MVRSARTSLLATAAGAALALVLGLVLGAATRDDAAAGTAGGDPATWLLPDLRQAPVGCAGDDPRAATDPAACTAWDVCPVAETANPHAECVTSGPIRAVRLRFTSGEENVGDGPLLVYGHRDGTGTPTMQVRQAFQEGRDGPIPADFASAQRPLPATMYYEPAAMHMHWHLLDFAHFWLTDGSGSVVVTDRKNGFCLGDRYDLHDAAGLPATPGPRDTTPQGRLARVLADTDCKMHQPDATDVQEGISVGSGDDYKMNVDFQWLDVTTVPSGTYTLVNEANPDRSVVEKDYTNNASSITISLRWPGGAKKAPATITAPPTVRILRSCPGSATCPVT